MSVEFGGLTISFLDLINTTIPALVIFAVGALVIAGMLVYNF